MGWDEAEREQKRNANKRESVAIGPLQRVQAELDAIAEKMTPPGRDMLLMERARERLHQEAMLLAEKAATNSCGELKEQGLYAAGGVVGATLGGAGLGAMADSRVNLTGPAYPMPARFGELAGLLDLAQEKVAKVEEAASRLEQSLRVVMMADVAQGDDGPLADGLVPSSDAGRHVSQLVGRLDRLAAWLEALRLRVAV